MKRKIVYSFITLFILLYINKYLLFTDVKHQDNNVKVVNIAGMQRMYVQKITKLALYYELHSTPELVNISGLQETYDLFEDNHNNLKTNYITNYNDFVLEELFNELEPYQTKIENSSKGLIANFKNYNTAKEFVTTIKNNESKFLKIMNAIVLRYEELAQQRIDEVKTREITFNTSYALIFIYILLFIFIPFQKVRIK